jgi:hypothetical protein
MTMILTCLTQDFVFQSSDRRISKVKDNKVQWFDDQSNKALVYKSQFVFAYTGQATIPVRKNGQTIYISTIDWAAEQLTKGKKLEEAVYNLKYRATELMNSNYVRKAPNYKRRVAFVGAGFEEIESSGKQIRSPLRIMIENCIGDDGSILDVPRDDFRVQRDPLNNSIAALYVAGQQLEENIEKEFSRLLKLSAQHNVNPEQIGVLLTRKLQDTAKAMPKDRKTVGENIMCICVPKAYIDNDDDVMKVPITGGIRVEISTNSDGSLNLQPMENVPLEERIRFLPSFDFPNSAFDSPRFAYIAEDYEAQPYHSPVYVRPGKIVPTVSTSGFSATFTPDVSTS